MSTGKQSGSQTTILKRFPLNFLSHINKTKRKTMGKIKTNIGRYLLTVLESSIGCPWSTVGNKLYELSTLSVIGADSSSLFRNVSVEVSEWGGKWDFKGKSVSPDESAKPLLSITDDEIKKMEIIRINSDMFSVRIHLAHPTNEVEWLNLTWKKQPNRGTNFHSAIAVAFRGITEPSLNSSIYSITAYDSQFVKIPFTIGITVNSGKNGVRRFADYSEWKNLMFVGDGGTNCLLLAHDDRKFDDVVVPLEEADLEITVGDEGLVFFALKSKSVNGFRYPSNPTGEDGCDMDCEGCAAAACCSVKRARGWKMFVFAVRMH